MEQTDVNIGSLCRLCGSKTQSGDKVEIFTSDDLSHQIRSLLGLDLSESDLLPTFVCAECAAKLADFNDFKASSHRTDLMFREFLDNPRDAIHVNCPGLSDNVVMETDLNDFVTIDEFKFEDAPEPVILANIEQFKESDPLSFELCSITESTSEVLPDNSKTSTHAQSSENTSEHLYHDSQLSSTHLESGPNDSNSTVQNQPFTSEDQIFDLHSKVQPVKTSNISKVQSPSTISSVQPCSSYAGVQFQIPEASPAAQPKDSYSTVQVLSTPKVPYNFTEHNYLTINNTEQNHLTNIGTNKIRKIHKCTYCNKISKNAYSLKIHIKIHNKDYDHFCQYCNKGFISKSEMQIHIRSAHTKEYPFECNKCGKKFVTRYRLRSHIETYHIKSKNYHCKICKKSFKLARSLRIHARRKHLGINVPIAFSCDVCDKVYDDKSNLVKHISKRHQERKEYEETVYPWSLEQRYHKVTPCTSTKNISSEVACAEPMPSVESSKSSKNRKQDPQIDKIDVDFLDPFKGKIFRGKTYSNPRKVKDYGTENPTPTESSNNKETTNTTVSEMAIGQWTLDISNNSEENSTESTKQPKRTLENRNNSKVKRAFVKIISCPHCFIVFKCFDELNFHIKYVHTITCTFCPKSFSHDQDLQEHIRAEHASVVVAKTLPGQFQEHDAKEQPDKKDFQCALCPKNFNSLRNMRSHQRRLHSGNRKKYICDICKDKEFLSKVNLARHITVTHLGILYTCEFCDKTFTSQQGITAHRESKHFNSKKHVCNICNKSFPIRAYLKVHIRLSHNDNKRRFQCTKCFKTFKGSKSLNYHLLKKKKNCINISETKI